LPDEVVGVEFEDVGVHPEDQQVAGHLELRFELAAVAVFDPHAAVDAAVEFVVPLGRHFEQDVFQFVERGERVVEDLLFEARFANDGFEDFRS
jgi:hypothetical protein